MICLIPGTNPFGMPAGIGGGEGVAGRGPTGGATKCRIFN